MKAFNEWLRERKDESWFGFGKPKDQVAPAPVTTTENPNQGKAFCPFCNDWSAVEDDAYYPKGKWEWTCAKCKRRWDSVTVDRERGEYEPGRGAPGTFLPKKGPSLIECDIKTLYLSGLISEETCYEAEQGQINAMQGQQNPAQQQSQQSQTAQSEIDQIASQLQFQPTSKKKLTYQYVESTDNMPAMSYTVAQQQMPVVTNTADGKETQNTAEPNDIIMSGPSREQYVIKAAKFPKLYVGQLGGPIHPEQSPRNVSLYTGNKPVTFTASWGESMVLKPGDYLVKEGEGKYYRIAKHEYELTYNAPGKVG